MKKLFKVLLGMSLLLTLTVITSCSTDSVEETTQEQVVDNDLTTMRGSNSLYCSFSGGWVSYDETSGIYTSHEFVGSALASNPIGGDEAAAEFCNRRNSFMYDCRDGDINNIQEKPFKASVKNNLIDNIISVRVSEEGETVICRKSKSGDIKCINVPRQG